MKPWMVTALVSLAASFANAENWVAYAPTDKALASAMQFDDELEFLQRTAEFEGTQSRADELRAQGLIVEARSWVHRLGERSTTGIQAGIPSGWAQSAMNVKKAHRLENSQGQGIRVCVLDSGVRGDHEILRGKVINETSFVPGETTDLDGHGTHVASLIAGATQLGSPAPQAKIISSKVLGRDGSGTNAGVARGVENCVQRGAHIISMSFGATGPSSVMKAALDRARASGVILIAAAGNDGGSELNYPAAFRGVWAVGAINAAKQVAAFSNRGDDLDFVAPGVDVWGARIGGGYVAMTGTSMATPFASGMMALRLSRQSAGILTRDLGYPASSQGRGLIDAVLTAQNNKDKFVQNDNPAEEAWPKK